MSQSIAELCKGQIGRVRARFLAPESEISKKVYKDACTRPSILYLARGSYGLSEMIEKTTEYEEAYAYIESQRLDFSATLKESNVGWGLRLPDEMCKHYTESELHIFDLNYKQKLSVAIGVSLPEPPYLDLSLCPQDKRGALVYVKVTPNKSLVNAGRYCRSKLKEIDEAHLHEDPNWMKIVQVMLSPMNGEQPVYEDPLRRSSLPTTFAADKFRNEAIARILALKTKPLPAMRPFIVDTCVWSGEIDWLARLMEKIIGVPEVVCPDSETVKIVNNMLEDLPDSAAVAHTPADSHSSNADYVIFYKAQLITLAEAVQTLHKMGTPILSDARVILIGGMKMPNLRVRCREVRDTCGSVLDWFHDKRRYPEYFQKDSPYIVRCTVSVGYHSSIFEEFKSYYEYQLDYVDRSLVSNAIDRESLLIKPIAGSVTAGLCSPCNRQEAEACVKRIQEMIDANIDKRRIGVLTTYCGQKSLINQLSRGSQCRVFIGVLDDFIDDVYDYLIISTVETAERVAKVRQYPSDDLLSDLCCAYMALTRGVRHITLIGDPDMLRGKDPWRWLLDKCNQVEPRKGYFARHMQRIRKSLRRVRNCDS